MTEVGTASPWRVLLVTGGLGAGKTAVSVEVGEVLARRGTPVSVVDLDQLCWTTPAAGSGVTVTDVLHGSLSAMLPVHAAAGVERLVLARLLRSIDEVDALRRLVAPAPLLVVELSADVGTRQLRLRRRDTGTTLDGHLDEVAHLLPAPDVADHVVRTDGLSVPEVAAAVVGLWDASS